MMGWNTEVAIISFLEFLSRENVGVYIFGTVIIVAVFPFSRL